MYKRQIEKATAYINEHALLAEKLNKPVVLEEFGISRDNNDHAVTGFVTLRDEYYNQTIHSLIVFLHCYLSCASSVQSKDELLHV